MKSPSLVVLAAGMGSRYGGLKQIDPVGPNGETLLDYSVADARAAGFDKVVFVIRREIAEAFHEAVGRRYEGEIEVRYAFQELEPLPEGKVSPPGRVKPWGTGHAVLAAGSHVDAPFAVINADDYYGPSGYIALARFLETGREGHYAMVGYPLEKTLSEHGSVSRGICETDPKGFLTSITERTAICRSGEEIFSEGSPRMGFSGKEPTSMNFWGFQPDIFSGLGRLFSEFLEDHGTDPKAEFYLPAAVGSLIDSGEASVRVLLATDSWFGLTYPQDRDSVAEALARLRP